MPKNLRRYHHTGMAHFVTVSCFHCQRNFAAEATRDLFIPILESVRQRYQLFVYGFVLPEHMHIMLSQPRIGTLADAMHTLKLSFSRKAKSVKLIGTGSFWQKRYHDRNVRDAKQFRMELEYLHRNPVERGLVKYPTDWKWSSARHYALREWVGVEIESEWTARDPRRTHRVVPEGYFWIRLSPNRERWWKPRFAHKDLQAGLGRLRGREPGARIVVREWDK